GMLSNFKTFRFWRSALILLSAVPIAIFTNALRVSGTGILARYYGTKVADGFFHTFSGWVIYVVAFLMLFGVGWALDRVGTSDARSEENEKGRQAALQNVVPNLQGATGGSEL
ncbi:MAG TPA: archaeosortase/exosortase family protein, partial [Pyrinomonadaceae bacterium]